MLNSATGHLRQGTAVDAAGVSESVVWYRYDGRSGLCRVGLKKSFARRWGAVTYIEPGELGMWLDAGEELATVETERGNYSVRMPVAGVLVQANTLLAADPDLVNREPAGAGWIAEYRPSRWPPA
jgi:glycine cleavage system H protein